MGEKTWERNTAGLASYTRQRKEQKHKQVEEATAALLREHRAVNFNSVARAAGVTKAYLYSQSDLRERIEALRQQGVERAVRERVDRPAQGKTDASKDLVILAKDRRIKELEAENRKLQQHLKIALGKAYDRL